ncbi:MAG: MerR family transcriptional regulator [Oscillibacter sp.]|nr:MerR family transcriptional regulator [Oscillibacter sp.]
MDEVLRISAFARRFGVPTSTVRYYIQRGILVPEVQNGQYLFSESCAQDMRRVMEFKELRFSLEDILGLLTQQRKFNLAQEHDVEAYLLLLRGQKTRLKKQLEEADEQESLLNQLERELTSASSGPQTHKV